MKKIFLFFVLFFVIGCTLMNSDVKTDDLASLSDEFNNPATLKNWTLFHETEGWPNRIEKIDINKSNKGNLTIVPYTCCWVGDLQGIYLFKKIKGDFMVTTRVHVSGKTGDIPDDSWAISGLMVRTPKNTTRQNWKPGEENWIYLMHGKSPEQGLVIDSKSNVNSKWNYNMTPSKNWLELRMARVGSFIISLLRFPGEKWIIRDRFIRKDMPETLHVGIAIILV